MVYVTLNKVSGAKEPTFTTKQITNGEAYYYHFSRLFKNRFQAVP